MPTMAAIGTLFTSVQKTVKTSSGSAVNIVICLVTVGSEQLFSFAAFQCPCPPQHNSSTTPGGFQQNYLYGWVFIIVPALALFVLGYGMNVKTWKLVTGCIYRSSEAARGYVAGCSTLLEIFMQALVAPLAWMSVAFLDGKYFACAATTTPYLNSCDVVAKLSKYSYTEEFVRNKQKSQIIGWCLIAATMFFGSVFYMLHRCLSPLTYHHRKYARWYRELESEAFEKRAKEQIKEEVENETVERFLQGKRSKAQWDKISTVFNFTRDKEKHALYSRLDEWNEANKEEFKLPGEKVTATGMTDQDDSSLETNTKNNNNSNGAVVQERAERLQETESQQKLREVNTPSPPDMMAMDQTKEPLLPIIPPPPTNAKRRRPPSPSTVQLDQCDPVDCSAQDVAMTSQTKSDTSELKQQTTSGQSSSIRKNAMREMKQSNHVTSPGGRLSLHDNDVISDLISMNDLRPNKSMSNVKEQTAFISHNGETSVNRGVKRQSSVYDNGASPMTDC